jgi:hypothetical protein
MKKVNLDSILEQALEQALASLTAKAAGMVEQALEQALAVKLQAILGEAPAVEAPAAPIRARGKAKAVEATPVKEEGATPTPAKARKRTKAKATPEATTPEDIETLLGAVEAAMAKYAGLTTPKGKPLPEVLGRRVERVLKYAQAIGRNDLPALARSAIAVIGTNPMVYAMGAWPVLAVALNLPDPIQAKVVGGIGE